MSVQISKIHLPILHIQWHLGNMTHTVQWHSSQWHCLYMKLQLRWFLLLFRPQVTVSCGLSESVSESVILHFGTPSRTRGISVGLVSSQQLHQNQWGLVIDTEESSCHLLGAVGHLGNAKALHTTLDTQQQHRLCGLARTLLLCLYDINIQPWDAFIQEILQYSLWV